MRIKLGQRYRVAVGAGLSTGREGVAVNPYPVLRQLNLEPGRYKPFDPSREVAIQEDDGTLFAMFPQYLVTASGSEDRPRF